MQIKSINNNFDKINFKAVYKFDAKYSKTQLKLVDNITSLLRNDNLEVFDTNMEKKYGEKGFDFIFEPVSDDKINLKGYLNLEKLGVGLYKIGRYLTGNSIDFGIYDNKKLFETKNAINLLENFKNNNKIQNDFSINTTHIIKSI